MPSACDDASTTRVPSWTDGTRSDRHRRCVARRACAPRRRCATRASTATSWWWARRPHRPYDRPPLSKKLLAGEWEPDRIHLRQPDTFDELGRRMAASASRAAGLDLGARRGCTSPTGRTLGYDGLHHRDRRRTVVASPEHGPHSRTCTSCARSTTRCSCAPRSPTVARRVVVIGAGFIGLEVAATARQLGNDVTVLEGAPAPLMRGLGAEMGAAIGAMHESGVSISLRRAGRRASRRRRAGPGRRQYRAAR